MTTPDDTPRKRPTLRPINLITAPTPPPITNYTLSTVCPNCTHPTIRRACKVRCERCGFMWDCSEL